MKTLLKKCYLISAIIFFNPFQLAKASSNAGAYGINAPSTDKSGSVDGGIRELKKLGVVSVRLWYSIVNWNDPSKNWTDALKAAAKYKKAGFDVMISIVPKNGVEPSSDAQVKRLVDYLMKYPGLRGNVDRWQIGNEPEGAEYWKSRNLKTYVMKFLRPAAQAFHRYGEKVVSAGPSWNPESVKTMVDAGMLSYVDFVGYHVYRKSLKEAKDAIAKVKSYARGKPLVASEWTMRGYTKKVSGGYGVADAQGWAKANKELYPLIAANFAYAYFFMTYVNKAMAGCFSILKSNGAHNEPSYGAFKAFPSLASGGSQQQQKKTLDEEPILSDSDEKPALTLLTMYNAQNDDPVPGYHELGSSEKIDLDRTRVDQVSFVAEVSDKTASVVFNYDGRKQIENVEPFASFGDGPGRLYGKSLKVGKHTLTVTPYSKAGAKGTAGKTQTVTITVIDSGK